MNFKQGGLTDILKDGTKHLSGLEQAVIRNIEAVVKLSEITRTSYGPFGLNKMVINHLDKLFVTHDAVTMLQQLEVIHPAANIAVMATISQEQEIGDGTNFVITLAGELLRQAETLIKMMRLHPSDIIIGYKKALKKGFEILEDNVVKSVKDLFDTKEVYNAMKSGITSKQYGNEDVIIPLIMEACMNVYKPLVESYEKNKKTGKPNFNVDNVRVVGITGGSLNNSYVIKGFILEQNVEGTIKHINKGVIAVFACNVDSASLDSKETVLIKNDKELLNYSKTEEEEIEKDIKSIADSGVNIIITQGSFGEMALHFIEKYKMMAIKCTSKFDLRRLCKSIGATPLVRLGKPISEELGHCDTVNVLELGSQKMIHFKQTTSSSLISTIILRGATKNIIKEVERCVNDGINIYRILTKDSRLVAGAGAIEMSLYKGITEYAESISGMDQYSVRKFAEAFLVIPRTLAESSGLDIQNSISNLISKHEKGSKYYGVDLDSEKGKDVVNSDDQILDRYRTTYWGIKFAAQAVLSILSIDQIIMARPSGGPKAPDKVKRELDLMKK